MTRTFKISISNWPRTRKFRQLLQAGKANAFFTTVTRWTRSTSNFWALIDQNWELRSCGKIYEASGNVFTDSWSWKTFVSSCDVFKCLSPLDVQNEIQWEYSMESAGVRYLRTSCWRIRNRTSERGERVRFLIHTETFNFFNLSKMLKFAATHLPQNDNEKEVSGF